MAEDWSADVRKYVSDPNANAIAGIVRYCGIALQKRDSSLVSFNDREEMERVRSNFLKKKLGLTNSDAEFDAAIKAVSEKMKSDHTKNRVTLLFIGRVLWKAFGSQLRRLVVQRHRQGAGVVATH